LTLKPLIGKITQLNLISSSSREGMARTSRHAAEDLSLSYNQEMLPQATKGEAPPTMIQEFPS